MQGICRVRLTSQSGYTAICILIGDNIKETSRKTPRASSLVPHTKNLFPVYLPKGDVHRDNKKSYTTNERTLSTSLDPV